MKKNLLAQLQSNEVILLMYLSGELPARDRAEIVHLLEHDSALRLELDQLKSTLSAVHRNLETADQEASLDFAHAASSASLAIRRWQADAAHRTPPRPVVSSLPLPWWCYPLAAAASILVAFSVWLSNSDMSHLSSSPDIARANFSAWVADIGPEIAVLDEPAAVPLADMLASTFDDSDAVLARAYQDSGLTKATRELETIRQLRQEIISSSPETLQ